MNTELRLYTFTNFYLNSISQGIQPAHVIGRMAKFYRYDVGSETPRRSATMFWDWLTEGMGNETMICLNGGMAADVEEAYMEHKDILSHIGLPTGIFYEEPRALGSADSKGAPTSWGVVLNKELYDAKHVSHMDVEDNEYVYNDGESAVVVAKYGSQLYNFLVYKNSCGMAR